MGTRIYRHSWDSNGIPYVNGPGDGLQYYGGTLYPNTRFSSDQDAMNAADIAETAYKEGYAKAQQDIRKALGISNA